MRISDWSSDVCSSDLSCAKWQRCSRSENNAGNSGAKPGRNEGKSERPTGSPISERPPSETVASGNGHSPPELTLLHSPDHYRRLHPYQPAKGVFCFSVPDIVQLLDRKSTRLNSSH